jgi:predicted deacetylase
VTICTVQDLRAAKICLNGARPWFRRHGFDWHLFVSSGIDAGDLARTGDALAFRVIDIAKKREAENGI